MALRIQHSDGSYHLAARRESMNNKSTKDKNHNCIAWKVHPGYGHVCYSMCSAEKRKICIDRYRNKLIKR